MIAAACRSPWVQGKDFSTNLGQARETVRPSTSRPQAKKVVIAASIAKKLDTLGTRARVT